jgi:hypothetical protein
MIKSPIPCEGCQISVPHEERGYVVAGRRYYVKFCPSCAREKWLEWRSEVNKKHYTKNKTSEEWATRTRDRLKKNSLKRKFDIDGKTYQRLFTEQNGLCACCGNPETMVNGRSGLVKSLAVDHNHETGEVRALLCTACNVAYGLLEESPERIKMLLLYAEKNLCQ